MPRSQEAKDLSPLFGALSHPDRLRLIGELRESEKDVHTLQEALGVSQSRVSQHLAVLRANRIVRVRKKGRRVFYSLTQVAMADWIAQGIAVLESILVV